MDQAIEHHSKTLQQSTHSPTRRDFPLGCVMVAPAILILLAIIVGPLIYSFILSFFSWRLTEIFTSKQFVFLDNYRAMLSDPMVCTALGNTAVYVMLPVGTELLFGFI